MIPFGTGVSAGLAIAERVGVDPAQGSWIVASYPSVVPNLKLQI